MISLIPLIGQEIQLKMLFANMGITPVLFQLRNMWNGRDKFFFCFWNCLKRENWKYSNKLNKAVQSHEIPSILVKEFGYLFSKYIARSIITLREKCPNTDQKKLRIWIVFTQCWIHSAQLSFTCSMLTIETLEKGVKYAQS